MEIYDDVWILYVYNFQHYSFPSLALSIIWIFVTRTTFLELL